MKEPPAVSDPLERSAAALLEELRIDRSIPEATKARHYRFWLVALILLLCIAAGFAFQVTREIPVRVVVSQSVQPSLPLAADSPLLDASGYVVARRRATVSAKVSGQVAEILVEEGDQVKAGQVIARLDDRNRAAELQSALSRVEMANAELDAAKQTLRNIEPLHTRKQTLAAKGWISAEVLDMSKLEFDTAQARVRTAAQSLAVSIAESKVALRNKEDMVIEAPFDGVVVNKAAQPGEIISPDSSGGGFTRTGICTLVDMDSLEVEVDVNENFIHRVQSKQRVAVQLNAYPEKKIPAEVIAIVPSADRAKATVKVRVGFKERDARIVPEMGVHVSFFSEPHQVGGQVNSSGVLVPLEAIHMTRDAAVVYLLDGDRVEQRKVDLGPQTPAGQIVLTGLAPGTKLAVGDFSKLTDGTRVRVAG